MADVINTLVDFMGQVSPILIYLLLFFIAYMENIVPPVPGDVIVAFGGYLISLESINGLGLWLGTVITSVLGFMKMSQMSHLSSDLIKAEDRAINIVDGDEDIIDTRVPETGTAPVCQSD